MRINIRCPLTQIPMLPGTEVVAVPLVKIKDKWHVAQAPIIGELTDSGTVVLNGRVAITDATAFIATKAAADALFIGRFAGAMSAVMRGRAENIEKAQGRIEGALDRAEAVEAYRQALESFPFPALMPNSQPVYQMRKPEMRENVKMLGDCARDAGWLPFVENILGTRVAPSSEHRTVMDQETHVQIVGGMVAAVEREKELSREYDQMSRMF